MSKYFRGVAVAMAVFMVLAAAMQVYAEDHHRKHPMPHVDHGVKVAIRPGEQVKLFATFSAGNENCVQVYSQAGGAMLQVWNNYDGGGGEWTSVRNASTDTIVLLIVSRHKNTPPGRGPWHLSPYRILDGGQEKGTMKVGFEDRPVGGDGDYDDAMVTVTWLK